MNTPADHDGARLRGLARGILDGLSRQEQGELFANQSRTVSLRWNRGELELERIAQARGAGLRMIHEGRYGYAYSSRLDATATGTLTSLAREAARANTGSLGYQLPPHVGDGIELAGICDGRVRSAGTGDRRAVHDQVTESVARLDPDGRVSIQRVQYVEAIGHRSIVSTAGVDQGYDYSAVSLWVELLRNHGTSRQTMHVFGTGRSPWDLAPLTGLPDAVARLRQAPRQAGSWRGRTTVVLSPDAATALLQTTATGLLGEAVFKRRSYLAGRIGQPVASELLTVLDDPFDVRGLAARPCDDEGTPSRRTVLIDNGVLAGYLHSFDTARAAGLPSTGHAYRSSYRATPEVAPSCVVVAEGERALPELLSAHEPCIYVHDLIGGRANSMRVLNGRYSMALGGYWWRGGGWGEPVESIGISGHLDDLWGRLVEVGRGAEAQSSSYSVITPALVFSDVDVKGRAA